MHCRNKPKTPAWLLEEMGHAKANAAPSESVPSESAPSAAVPEQTAPEKSPTVSNTQKVDDSKAPAPVVASPEPVSVPETQPKPVAKKKEINRAAKRKGVRRGRKRGAPKVPLWVVQEMSGKSNPAPSKSTSVETGTAASPKQMSEKVEPTAPSKCKTNRLVEKIQTDTIVPHGRQSRPSRRQKQKPKAPKKRVRAKQKHDPIPAKATCPKVN